MKTKVYLAKSNECSQRKVAFVREYLKKQGLQVKEYNSDNSGKTYSHKDVVESDYLVVLPAEANAYCTSIGRGLRSQIEAFRDCHSDKNILIIAEIVEPKYTPSVHFDTPLIRASEYRDHYKREDSVDWRHDADLFLDCNTEKHLKDHFSNMSSEKLSWKIGDKLTIGSSPDLYTIKEHKKFPDTHVNVTWKNPYSDTENSVEYKKDEITEYFSEAKTLWKLIKSEPVTKAPFEEGDKVIYKPNPKSHYDNSDYYAEKAGLIPGGEYQIETISRHATKPGCWWVKIKDRSFSLASDCFVSALAEATNPVVSKNPFKIGDEVRFIKSKIEDSFYENAKAYTHSLTDNKVYTVGDITSNGLSQHKGMFLILKNEGTWHHPHDCFELVGSVETPRKKTVVGYKMPDTDKVSTEAVSPVEIECPSQSQMFILIG